MSALNGCCRKFRHHKMRQASVRLVLSFVLWGVVFSFGVAIVFLVWGAITVHSHVMHEEQMKVVQYSLDTFAASCPPVSPDQYKNAVTWVADCQDLPFESTLRGMNEAVSRRSIDQALLHMPQTTTFRHFPSVTPRDVIECEGGGRWAWHSVSSVYCWARAILLSRDQVLLVSLLANVLLMGVVTFVLSPWSSCQRWHAEWEKKEAEDEHRIEQNFNGLGTEHNDTGWSSALKPSLTTVDDPMSSHPRPPALQWTEVNENWPRQPMLKTYLTHGSAITQRKIAVQKGRHQVTNDRM